MAKNNYQLVANLAVSSYLNRDANGVPAISGKEDKIPDQVVGDSFALSILVYDDYDAGVKHDYGASASAILYLKTKNSNEDPIELDAAGTVTQSAATEYDTVDFAVARDVITSVFDNKDCTIYAEIISSSGTEQRTLLQHLKIFSPSGTGVASPETADIAISTAQIVAKASAPAVTDDDAAGYAVGDYIYDSGGAQLYKATSVATGAATWSAVSALDSHVGIIIYLINATASALSIALPTGVAGEAKLFKHEQGAYQATITGTILNVSSILLDAGNDAALVRGLSASSWVNLNFDTYIS